MWFRRKEEAQAYAIALTLERLTFVIAIKILELLLVNHSQSFEVWDWQAWVSQVFIQVIL